MASMRGMRILKKVVKKEVIRAVTTTHKHRFNNAAATLTLSATTNLGLLLADDDPDYEVGGDFSTSCECEADSKIIDIDLSFIITGGTAGSVYSWILVRREENAIPTTMTFANLFSNDDSAENNMLRKNTLAAGRVIVSTNSDQKTGHVRVRRSALARAGKLHDLDQLYLCVTNSGGSNATFCGWGSITTSH